jgi:small-conductance mechanosensitive channel
MMIVPNSKMLQSGVKSLMRGNGAARFRVCVGVSYESDMEKAKLIVTKAVLSHPKIEEEPKPTIILKSFDESGVTLEVRFWMKELFNSENILSDVRFAILDSFRKDGISIPYPHRVITEKK